MQIVELYKIFTLSALILIIIQSVYIIVFFKILGNLSYRLQLAENISFRKDISTGRMAPIFKLKDYFKHPIKVGPNMKSEVVLVFVSTTCPGCKNLINNLRSNLGNLVFVSNNLLDDEAINKIKNYNYGYINSSEVFQKYHIIGVPKIISIDRSGVIIDSGTLYTWHDLK